MNCKLTFLSLLLYFFSIFTSIAQTTKPVNLEFEARGDYKCVTVDGTKQKNESGFKGNIVNIILKGDITSKFSYGFRNRMNKMNTDNTFFDATDWLYLKYKPTKEISILAGKYIVLVAGWELLPAPIDCYALSEFCYGFPCYQWGVVAEYTTPNKKNTFSAQICQSPYEKEYKQLTGKAADMYAYNTTWTANYGIIEPYCSVNFMEYAPNKFINYLSLCGKIHIADNVQLELDYWNRATSKHTYLGKDYSVVGQLSYQPSTKWNIFAKTSYEVNKSGTDADYAVQNGTELTRISGGVEYYPLKNKNIRIHGNYSYSFGKNSNPNGEVKDKMSYVNIGVTWRGKVL